MGLQLREIVALHTSSIVFLEKSELTGLTVRANLLIRLNFARLAALR